MDRRAWLAMFHRVSESWIRVTQPSMHANIRAEMGILHNFHITEYILLIFCQLIKKKKRKKKRKIILS